MRKNFSLSLMVGLFLSLSLWGVPEISGQPCNPNSANRDSVDILRPPEYGTFQPPAVGGSYCDPTFGTEVKRLTASGKGYVTNSEIAFFNMDDSYFLATDNNIAYLFDGKSGQKIKEIRGGTMRPWWIRWPRANYYTLNGVRETFDPTRYFYKYEGNEVRLYDVDTLHYVVLHKFDEYSEIGPAGGEGDISLCGRFWVLDGTRKSDGKPEAFAYDLLEDIKGSVNPFEIGSLGGQGSGADYATISPSGKYIVIAWDAGPPDPFNGHYGVEVFEKETWEFVRRVHPTRIHFELGYDAFGHEVFFAAAGNTAEDLRTFNIPDLAAGDQISVRLEDGFGRKLLDVPRWAHYVLSYAGGQNEYIFASYMTRSDSPETLWAPYWGEILAIPTNGSGKVVRLVHHRSQKVGNQGTMAYQPDLITSNSGTEIVFHSTFGIGGADLYMLDVDLTENGGPIQPPEPPPPPPNQPPVAYGDNISTREGGAVSGTLRASDPDGDALSYGIETKGSLGRVELMDVRKGTYTYTPSPCAEGVDSFTFKANDGKADSNVAAVVVTIASSSRCTDVSLPPPNYSTLKSPERGESYSDPTFGTLVKRLTDSGKADLTNPEVAYFNVDDSYFVAVDDNVTYLWDGKDGRKIKPLGDKTMKPWWIRWPRANYYTASGVKEPFDPAQHFYKYEGNEVRLYHVDTLTYVVLRKFNEYAEIGPVGGKSDLSADGRYWLLDGKKPDGKRVLFVYDLLDDVKGSESPFDCGQVGSARYPGVHFGTVSPSGKYLVLTWNVGSSSSFNRHYGVEVFDRQTWEFVRRIHPIWVQFKLGYDSSNQEVLFAPAGNTPDHLRSFGIPDLALGDLIAVRLDNGIGWKLLDIPVRASFSLGFAQSQNQYVFLSLEARSDNPEKQWAPYWGEILAVPTDGSGKAVRLVHHRSQKVGSYSYWPFFMVNHRGTKLVFQSTFGVGGPELYMFDFEP